MNFENFSQGIVGNAPTPTDMGNALYGTLKTCCFSGQSPFTAIANSNSTLTYTNTSACSDGGPPATINGVTTHSGLILDYNTTQGNGHNNQFITLRSPNEVGTPTMGGFWFCTDIPVTDSFGTTNDFLQVIGGSSRLANFNSNGSSQNFGIETCTGPCQGTIPRGTVGTTLWIAWQHVSDSTGCSGADPTHCMRLAIFNRSLTLIAEEDATVTSGGTANHETFGNGNSATMSSGHHMQFSDIVTCWVGCTASMFPLLPNNPWLGILSGGRGIDWTQSGISQAVNQGTLPSSAWAQCGSPVAAGTSAATIQTLLNACSANTYLLLGAGAFNLSTNFSYPTGGNVEVRGSGADTTFLIFSGNGGCAGQVSAAFCIDSSDHTNTGTPPTAVDWTAGYIQGSNKITLSSVAGISLNSTMLYLDECDTGLSGSSTCPTGTNTDNGNLYVCGLAYSAGNGCSFSGPDAGGMRPLRNQLEIHTATAINGNVVTITPPLSMPNWASGQTPQVWIAQPITNVGLTNMSIDLSNASAPTACAETLNAYKIWVRGVRCVNPKSRAFNFFQMASSNVQDNYIYHPTGTLPSNYGFRRSASAYNVVQNNIIQQVTGGADFQDGASVGDVSGYNLVLAADSGGNIGNPSDGHSGNFFGLVESPVGIQDSCDNTHGTCGFRTRFRPFLAGWTSNPSSPVGTFNRSIDDYAYSRYSANIAGVYGTPGNTTIYSSTGSNGSNFSNGRGGGGPGVPNDSLSASTSLKWANWDNVTAGCTTVSACSTATFRLCGNSLDTGWSSPCGSASESPTAASTFPNFVPVIGDTAIGQPGLPASLYLTAKPLWFQSISWPAIGPDISGGNVGQCSGTLNTNGQMAGMPATTGSQCTGTSLLTSWGGHVKAIPALNCYLNVMGGPPDGNGAVLSFNADTCYAGGVLPQATQPAFSPVGGTYPTYPSVTIATFTGGVICWNTTGAPSTNGAFGCSIGFLYTGPIPLLVNGTIFAVAGGTGFSDSQVGSATYSLTPITSPNKTVFAALHD